MEENEPQDSESSVADGDLPLEIIQDDASANVQQPRRRALPPYYFLAFVPLLLFTGAVVGIYIQPPALRAFLRVTGLKPGGGTSSPIAVPVETEIKKEAQQPTIRSVVALGRLVPEGKVITIAPPFGSSDARIAEMRVEVGTQVKRGETLAMLDNLDTLQSALVSAEANVALQRTSLEQTRATILASLAEAEAAVDRAKAGEALARSDFERAQSLRGQSAISQQEVDQATAAYAQAKEDVSKAEATVTRFAAQDIENQPDVAVAARKLDSALADLNRAKHDMAKSVVTAPVDGTVLDIHARPGEKPGAKGILEIGNIQQMTAELEVYQADIGRIEIGQRVAMSAAPLQTPLVGLVSRIGFEVERQTTIRDDPAANTDARIVKVTVKLDDESSKRAARLTNLEVIGQIAVEASP